MHASMENQASVWIALTARRAAPESDRGSHASASPSSLALMMLMSRPLPRIRRLGGHRSDAFSTVPDPSKHPLGHHETDRLSGLDEKPGPRPHVGIPLTHE